jgi:hypothetical protein
MSYWANFIKEVSLAENIKYSVDDAMSRILDAERSKANNRSAVLEGLLSWDRTFSLPCSKEPVRVNVFGRKTTRNYIRVSLGSKIIFLPYLSFLYQLNVFPVPISSKMSIQETVI